MRDALDGMGVAARGACPQHIAQAGFQLLLRNVDDACVAAGGADERNPAVRSCISELGVGEVDPAFVAFASREAPVDVGGSPGFVPRKDVNGIGCLVNARDIVICWSGG